MNRGVKSRLGDVGEKTRCVRVRSRQKQLIFIIHFSAQSIAKWPERTRSTGDAKGLDLKVVLFYVVKAARSWDDD